MHKLFPSQQEDEKIYVVIRQHWMVLFKKILVWVLLASALVLFKRFGQTWAPGILEGGMGRITNLFMEVYTLFLILSLYLIWVLYYLNVQIITDRRLVDIDQVGLFFHEVSELHIENIEDVTSDVSGVLGTVFNYGDVYVQTAASIERFEFSDVPNPAGINKLILDLYEKSSKENKPNND